MSQRTKEPHQVARGNQLPHAKLTPEIVRECRQRWMSSRITYRELAKEYGVHLQTMTKAINRMTWKHVE